MIISKGNASRTINSITSHGEFRNSWVMNHDIRRRIVIFDICASPKIIPATVPNSIEKSEMMMLNRKPDFSRNGIHFVRMPKAVIIVNEPAAWLVNGHNNKGRNRTSPVHDGKLASQTVIFIS